VRTFAVIIVLAATHAGFGWWLFLTVVWCLWPQPIKIRATWN
jgi:hypothetical protein